ncbi:MAG: hypothetical protein IJT01_04140 [Selenomonadaceae bacterium]|nr:hypothetical protein [Selenomonadaceae bacterium]
MGNMINTAYSSQLYKSIGQAAKNASSANKGNNSDKAKDPFMEKYGGDFNVELSSDGLAALANQRKQELDNAGSQEESLNPEQKLSAKAQDYLAKLREQYGDYDFIIADDVNDPKALDQATKQYSVILRGDELERMANDEDYAAEVMGKVESAIDMTKRIEEKGELGEGVQFKRIAISFDDDGNMKLFAELEKMSEQQKERMEKAKEKRAEEKEEADKKAEKDKEADDKPKLGSVKHARVEATSEEELLEKILGIDWSKISEEDE